MSSLLIGSSMPTGGRYGVQIGNLPFISGTLKIMRLLALGTTRTISQHRHAFRFVCRHRDFCVYFRPLENGRPTASQLVHHVGGGQYDAYFVGSPCQVYVYERKSDSASGRYGLFLYNEGREVAFDHADEPMQPLPNLYIPPLGVDGSVRLFDAATTRKRAINMHCVRGALALNMWNKHYCIYRDSVMLDGGSLHYVYGKGANWRPFSGQGHNIPFDTNIHTQRWSLLSPRKPTSVGVVDTSHH